MKRKIRKKKIYRWKSVLVDACMWCNGTGQIMGFWHLETCLLCNGTGGTWKRQRYLVGEETVY